MHDTAHGDARHGPWMARLAGPLTLCCWGAVFLAFFSRGELTVFVAPFFRPLIGAAGAALSFMGLVLCFLPSAASPCCHAPHGHEHAPGTCCGHAHDHGAALSGPLVVRTLVLFLPLALLFWVRPEGFSATTVKNRGILRQPPPAQRRLDARIVPDSPKTPARPLQMEAEAIFEQPEENRLSVPGGKGEELTVYEIMVASADPELRQRMSGNRVRVLGQVVRDSKNPARFDLVRMFIVCCAADARVLGLKVAEGDISSMDEMAWVEIEGRLEFEAGPGIPQPLLHAQRLTPAEEPDEPFLY